LIALDTNILVYAYRGDSPFHSQAGKVLSELAEGNQTWAIPWPVVHEFLGIVTHPHIFRPPSPLENAFAFLDSLLESPGLRLLSEGSAHLSGLKEIARSGKIAGPAFHDAKIAAICLGHGVKELWSADRDFSRMKGLRVRNPLIGG
jgi:uncharacterized protein